MPLRSERLGHRHHARDLPSRLGDRVVHESVDTFGGASEEHQAHRAVTQQAVHRQRVEPVGEGFLAPHTPLLVGELVVGGADFRFEVVDDPALGAGDEVGVADRHADQDAEGEREQDRGQGQRVIAIVEHP